MLGVGPEEILFVLVLALLVLGPDRLPQVARDLGRFVGDLRRTSDELRAEFLNADRPSPAYREETLPARAGGAEAAGTPPESVSAGPPGETAFDREMREARERLRET